MEKHLSSPSHPYNKFGTGSLETLWSTPKSQDRDPRAELIEWWKKEYCSSRMKLVVLGKEPLDVLEGWVRERFEKVPYKGKAKVMYSDKVFEEEQMGVSHWFHVFHLIGLHALTLDLSRAIAHRLCRTRQGHARDGDYFPLP